MSNLRVTDVQAFLRQYANTGHDVLSDPRHLHLDGKKYSMAVGHELYIPSESTDTDLHSFLQQSERPLISVVRSSQYNRPIEGKNYIHRAVAPLTPIIYEGADDLRGARYGITKMLRAGSNIGHYSDESSTPQGTSPLWTPSEEHQDHKSIHEALESHLTPDVSHSGQIYDVVTMKNTKMTPKELSEFDHKAHIAKLVDPSPAFGGLISVIHGQKGNAQHKYTYNPDTEQLFKHEG